ncbi:MAG: ADP-ribosylglycohydrolase family protein [Tissierellia bacterium]|nr:ADP-ribosylglycohydrolase family protein [Tissierellia bacterium]
MTVTKYSEKIYAGVLGKLIGVYLGRPVEGWSYEKIQETFDEIKYYVHDKVGAPLIVADDDISGTFGFFKALEDFDYSKDISAEDFGRTWLNYIIEDKTILWWGGLGRSTEHTAFLNLKNGISAPQSGSIEQNGRTLAEQIGAQIFIDAIAMACPGNPDLAVDLVRKAASVSHDGLALDAACHLAALQAMAFEEKDLDILFDRGIAYVQNRELIEMIEDVRQICKQERDWRKVRAYLDPKYGYGVCPGCCHMIPNHAMVVASILLGGDDFQKSISIASSAAWDTDCNAGNVGAFNGIRLGLAGIEAGLDYRSPVADRMYVVNSDGGSVVSDAVIESKKILIAAAKLAGEEAPSLSASRFSFEFPGATQGFQSCHFDHGYNTSVEVSNTNLYLEEHGLEIIVKDLADGVTASVSTPTFIDFSQIARNFSTVASPSLYSSQIVKTRVKLLNEGEVSIRPYVLYYGLDNEEAVCYAEYTPLSKEEMTLEWQVPDTGGMPIFKLGFQIQSQKKFAGSVQINSISWDGAPTQFAQRGMLMTSIWNTAPLWSASFASSAKHFAADFKQTYCVSHDEKDGLATIGTEEWKDYSVTSTCFFSLHRAGGLVARSKGHKRYYGAALNEYKEAILYKQRDEVRTVLARAPFVYEEDIGYELRLQVQGDQLRFFVDQQEIVTALDDSYTSGGAGFTISEGTMTANNFIIGK